MRFYGRRSIRHLLLLDLPSSCSLVRRLTTVGTLPARSPRLQRPTSSSDRRGFLLDDQPAATAKHWHRPKNTLLTRSGGRDSAPPDPDRVPMNWVLKPDFLLLLMNLKAGLVFVYVWQVTAADFLEYFAQILQKKCGLISVDPAIATLLYLQKNKQNPKSSLK